MEKKYLVVTALGAAALLGAIGGSSLNAVSIFAQNSSAQSPAPSASASPASSSRPQGQVEEKDPSQATHVGSNGQREQLLTGDTAQKVKDSALKAVPGGTIQRVETEVDGNGIYEAHMTKADGTRVTVFFDANFNVTSQQEGKGMKAR